MKKRILAVLLLTAVFAGNTLSTTAAEKVVEGEGYIGLDDGTDPESLISVKMPKDFQWFVTNETGWQIQSPSHMIKNESEKTNLVVTLKEFKQKEDNVEIPGDLTLNFTGHLLQEEPVIGKDIVGYEGNTAYKQIMAAGSAWSFGFDGTYKGTIPATGLQPTYKMILNFSLDSVIAE